MAQWEKEEVKSLADNIGLNTKEIYLKYCDTYGSDARSYDSIQKKVKKIREAYADEPEEIEVQSVGDQIEKLLSSVPPELFMAEIDSERKKELKQEAKWWLEGLVESTCDLVFPPDQVPQRTASTLCVLISDAHIGKHNNHYNLNKARERIASIPTKILAQEDTNKVDEVLIMFAGDIIEGEDIFRTQAHHIECPAIDQMRVASESLWSMLLHFRHLFNCPVRVETVPGNHGRMSRTANEKTNWDNVIYHILRSAAVSHPDKQLIVNANFDMFRTFQVKDRMGMIYHQGVKHTGTPAMREKVAGWSTRKQFDFMCHGHWHEWHVGNWLSKVVIANGCICGPDDLAERMAKEDTARQAYFYVTPGLPLHGFGVIEWPD